MCKKAVYLACFAFVLWMGAGVSAEVIMHYGFDGTVGGKLPATLVDETGTYTATYIEGTDPMSVILYAGGNPISNPLGTSARFYGSGSGDNSNDCLSIPDEGTNSILDFSPLNGFTVEAYIYPERSGDRRIFSKDNNCYMYLDNSNTLHAVRKWGGGEWNENRDHLAVPNIPVRRWSHVAMTWDGTAVGDKMKLYVNGALAAGATGTSTPTVESLEEFTIGGYQRTDSSRRQYFQGRIDELWVDDTALEAKDLLISESKAAWASLPIAGAEHVLAEVILRWSPGVSAARHDVYLGTNFNSVFNAADPNVLPGRGRQDANSYDPGGLEYNQTYYWRIDEVNNADIESPWKGQVWSLSIGGKAYEPVPSSGAANVAPDVVLKWSEGFPAARHDVYVGTGYAEVLGAADPNVFPGRGRQDANSYTPDNLKFDTTYYWRVDEVGDEGTYLKGDVWNFIVGSYSVREDFESYADTGALLSKWSEVSGAYISLSTLQYHGGAKSMELEYYNASGFLYSEACRTYSTPQDWTAGGAEALEVFFRGLGSNTADKMYVVLEDTNGNSAKVMYDGDVNDVTREEWQSWNVDLAGFSDGGVDVTAVEVFCIGLGDRDTGQASGSRGFVYFDDTRLHPPRCVPSRGPAGDLDGDCFVGFGDISMLSSEWLDSEYTVVAVAPDANGLMAHYAFDETSGSTAHDSSGNAFDGTLDANAVNPWDPNGYNGKGCINFDGRFEVELPYGVFANVDKAVTISVWVNGDVDVQPDPNWGMIFNGHARQEERTLLVHCPTKRGHVMFESGGYNVQRLSWEQAEPEDWEGLWNHYVFMVDAAKGFARIYHNGYMVAEGDATTAVRDIHAFTIGCGHVEGNNYPYFGRLDDFRIYNYALSHAGVAYLFGASELYVPFESPVDLSSDSRVNYEDYAILANLWLEEQLWPY